MAVSSFARAFPSFECRSDPEISRPEIPSAGCGGFSANPKSAILCGGGGGPAAYGLSSLILRFPPNFVRQLSNKARRNCSNIGVAQVVAASWSNNQGASGSLPAAKAVDAAAAAVSPVKVETGVETVVADGDNVQIEGLPHFKYASFLNSDGSVAIHAGERLGRGIVTDAITTPVVNTSAYFFKKTADLIDFKEKRSASFEYGRYGNYTTVVAEEKISALEGAESTILMASGMCVSTVMLLALVPAGGHLVTTTDCYRKTRIFIETFLPKMGITATVIDPADIDGLESALVKNKVTLFFTESPTNPFLRCVDIEPVSKLCHDNGALVCIDGTFATSLNQKALALGADIVLHSATKFIGGHNDVLAGSISGPEKIITIVRNLHRILGGALNPNAAYLIIRGMKTLHLHVQQQNSTAQRMAEILEAHPKLSESPALQFSTKRHNFFFFFIIMFCSAEIPSMKTDSSKYENKNVSYELTTDYPSLRIENGRLETRESNVKVGSSLPRWKQLKKKYSSKSLWIAAAAGAAATAVAFFLGGQRGKMK